ncbi:MAG: hypothetical protein ABIQ02_09515 [Saprospiraceae bacterium]
MRNGHFHQEGLSTGNLDTTITQFDSLQQHEFFFGPAKTSPYSFDLPFYLSCPYFLVADDGPCNDRYAQVGIIIEISVQQDFTNFSGNPGVSNFMPVEGGIVIGILSKCVRNEAISDLLQFGELLQFNAKMLQQNLVTKITVKVRVLVKVSGAGSIADVNFSKGKSHPSYPQ